MKTSNPLCPNLDVISDTLLRIMRYHRSNHCLIKKNRKLIEGYFEPNTHNGLDEQNPRNKIWWLLSIRLWKKVEMQHDQLYRRKLLVCLIKPPQWFWATSVSYFSRMIKENAHSISKIILKNITNTKEPY